MLSEDEKGEFVLSTIRPMADYTMPFLTQVIGVVDERTGEHRGSAFFCEIDGRQAVVTAAHVLREAKETGRFVSIAFTRGSGEPPAIVAGKIVYSDDFDLAVYFPSRNFPLGTQKRYWPETRLDLGAERLSSDYLFVQGFPGRFSRMTTLLGDALVSDTLAYGAMRRIQTREIPSGEVDRFLTTSPDYHFLPSALLKAHQFAFNFSIEQATFLGAGDSGSDARSSTIADWSEVFVPGDGETLPGQKPRGPGGLSGSPVWRIGASGRSVRDWTPDCCELVGIVTHWNPEERILIATHIAKMIELAWQD